MKKLVPLLVLMLGLSACGSEDLSRFFYTFDKAEDIEKIAEAYPQSVLIRPLDGADWLKTREIVVRPARNRIDTFDKYSWVAEPGEMIAEQIFATAIQMNLFKNAHRQDILPSRFIISGYVRHFEMIQGEDSLTAWVAADLKLIDRRNMQTEVRHQFERFAAIDEDENMQFFAQTATELMQMEIELFLQMCATRMEIYNVGRSTGNN
jgi:ABC-type uncharacterized transport system auxiliary subunit